MEKILTKPDNTIMSEEIYSISVVVSMFLCILTSVYIFRIDSIRLSSKFYLFLLSSFFIIMVTGLFARRIAEMRLGNSFRGYDIKDNIYPRRIFGWANYEIIRVQPSGYRPYNLLSSSPSLDKLNDRQSKILECKECGNSNRLSGFQYIETRETFYLFGYPLNTKIESTVALCEEHAQEEYLKTKSELREEAY